MSENNSQLEIVLNSLSETINQVSDRLTNVLTEQATAKNQRDNLKELFIRELEVIKGEVHFNSKVLRHGRGGDNSSSIVTKVELILDNMEDLVKKVDAIEDKVDIEKKKEKSAKWKMLTSVLVGLLGIVSTIITLVMTGNPK